MRSSTGAHFVALDHVRAVAAFLVVTWHFAHTTRPSPGPFEYAPAMPFFALLDQGHTGVALFMTLSGYLFAKLLDGKTIDFRAFLWNRALRLFPLLALVLVVVGIIKISILGHPELYLKNIVEGAIFPTLPNGGWSITTECHFYLLLPLLLSMQRKTPLALLLVVVAAMTLRTWIFQQEGQTKFLAYFTLVGRIDQFVFGMLAFRFRALLAHRHVLAGTVMAAFTFFIWYYEWCGGFTRYAYSEEIWVVFPTVEAIAYSVIIAWYDNSFSPRTTGVSAWLGRIGEYSYSIYLLHFFFYPYAAMAVQHWIMKLSNLYVASAWSLVFFLLMVPVAHLTYRFVESPFFKYRRRYVGTEQERLRPAAPAV